MPSSTHGKKDPLAATESGVLLAGELLFWEIPGVVGSQQTGYDSEVHLGITENQEPSEFSNGRMFWSQRRFTSLSCMRDCF